MNCDREPDIGPAPPPDARHPPAAVLLAEARCVLFDFDGPICHLFKHRPSDGIAADMHDRVASLCAREGLPKPAPERADSPVHILAEAARLWRDRRAVAWLERFLRDHEAQAARLAPLTPGAYGLVRALAGRGTEMAVTTNNAQEVVAAFLHARLPGESLSGRVYGRQDLGGGHPLALKPDPDCINRAMEAFPGLEPQHFLMIGDSADDLHAARAAGVGFLGIRHPDGSAPPEGCPPWAVVESMEEARRLLTPPPLPAARRPPGPPASPQG